MAKRNSMPPEPDEGLEVDEEESEPIDWEAGGSEPPDDEFCAFGEDPGAEIFEEAKNATSRRKRTPPRQ